MYDRLTVTPEQCQRLLPTRLTYFLERLGRGERRRQGFGMIPIRRRRLINLQGIGGWAGLAPLFGLLSPEPLLLTRSETPRLEGGGLLLDLLRNLRRKRLRHVRDQSLGGHPVPGLFFRF
jgi:hypothetical protein